MLDTYDNKNTFSGRSVSDGFLCILAVISILYISVFPRMLLLEVGGLIALTVFSCVFSILLSKQCSFLCAIPIPFAVVAIVAPVLVPGFDSLPVTSLKISNVLFAFITAGALFSCAKKKARASTTFATLTAAGTLYYIVIALFIVFLNFGNIFPNTIVTAINNMDEAFRIAYENMFASLSASSGENTSLADMRALIDDLVFSIKATLPSFIIIFSMVFSAFVFIFYKFFVKISAAQKECTQDREMKFNMTPVSCIVFEIVYLVYLIFMIFGTNDTLYAAVMNLVYVLTVPFAYIGIRQIYSKLSAKIKSKFLAVLLIIVVLFILFGLAGPVIISFIALWGASLELNKRFLPKH